METNAIEKVNVAYTTYMKAVTPLLDSFEELLEELKRHANHNGLRDMPETARQVMGSYLLMLSEVPFLQLDLAEAILSSGVPAEETEKFNEPLEAVTARLKEINQTMKLLATPSSIH